MTKRSSNFRLVAEHDDAAYLYLPAAARRPGWKAAKSIDVTCFIEGYQGPDVRLDFDERGELMGIEILDDRIGTIDTK